MAACNIVAGCIWQMYYLFVVINLNRVPTQQPVVMQRSSAKDRICKS